MTDLRRLSLAIAACLAVAGCGGGDDMARGPDDPAPIIGEPAQAVSTNGAPDAEVPGGAEESSGDEEPSVDPDAPSAVDTDDAGCTGAGLEPSRENVPQVASATLCLLNAERTARSLRSLRSNPRLRRAAVGHARDMITRGYFAHDSESGATLSDRVRRAGYIRARDRWVVGENIAWGSGSRATPGEIVRSWMASPGHRANILRGDFREVGLGLVLGAPAKTSLPGATYNTDFGARFGG